MAMWDFDKEVATEFNDKYRVQMKTITKGGKTLYQFFISDIDFDSSSILFTKSAETGYFEPYIYGYKENEGGLPIGSIITKGSVFYDWIINVRQVFTRYNQAKKKYEDGSLYVLQWIISFDVIDNIINNTGRSIQLLGTRQWTWSCL